MENKNNEIKSRHGNNKDKKRDNNCIHKFRVEIKTRKFGVKLSKFVFIK